MKKPLLWYLVAQVIGYEKEKSFLELPTTQSSPSSSERPMKIVI